MALLLATDADNEAGVFEAPPCASWRTRDVDGVLIPFASPRLLWRMKSVTGREKDAADLIFLRQWFAARGDTPPPA
jgi:hypothetical protein